MADMNLNHLTEYSEGLRMENSEFHKSEITRCDHHKFYAPSLYRKSEYDLRKEKEKAKRTNRSKPRNRTDTKK
jgi:chlorite dismutase